MRRLKHLLILLEDCLVYGVMHVLLWLVDTALAPWGAADWRYQRRVSIDLISLFWRNQRDRYPL